MVMIRFLLLGLWLSTGCAPVKDTAPIDADGDGFMDGADCDDDDCADTESCQPQGNSFTRGDANTDGNVDISDPTTTLQYLFLGGDAPPCEASADSNGDGNINISDPTYTLQYLFLGGPAHPDLSSCDP